MHIGEFPDEILCKILRDYTHHSSRWTTPRAQIPVKVWKFGAISTFEGAQTNPIILGQVCSHWRATTSRSMPCLWSSICVKNPTPKDLPILSLWMKRSRSSLINIRFIKRESLFNDRELCEMLPFLFKLGTTIPRWRRVHYDLMVSSNTRYYWLFDIPPHIVPSNLEEMRVDLDPISKPDLRPLQNFVQSAQRLQRLSCNFGRSECQFVSVATNDIPTQMLVSLHLHAVGLDSLLTLLSSCARLQTLSIRLLFSHPHLNPVISNSPLCVPGIGTICFPFSSTLAEVLLPHLTLPSLKEVWFLEHLGSVDATLQSLQDLLHRSGTGLGRLVYANPSQDEVMKVLLSPMSADVTQITLRDPHVLARMQATADQNKLRRLGSIKHDSEWAFSL
ncbi:hypothetical protein FA15DRAFT_675369 [Coprinopsis marcescibilis]|uniref:F-box domain-containing protein n=1 Tax=Coprinopsis marcescibilis TaxID=230819 RepID=A0A5C3KEA0_COPMA|nr:hypothetical protein FA15DRAFT_675369 [Coprinopsis marcescibilis]